MIHYYRDLSEILHFYSEIPLPFPKSSYYVGAIKPNDQRQKVFLRLYNNLNQPKVYIVVCPSATRSPDHSLFTYFIGRLISQDVFWKALIVDIFFTKCLRIWILMTYQQEIIFI